MPEFGERLRSIRSDRGLSQIQLAEKMGLTQASISQFELGQRLPTPALIEKFAEKLQVSKEELAGVDNGEFERTRLMRNLNSLPPEAVEQINNLVEMLKRANSKKN